MDWRSPQILPGKVPHAVGRQGGLSSTWLGKQTEKTAKGDTELVTVHKIMWGDTSAAVPQEKGKAARVAPLPEGHSDAEAPSALGVWKPRPGPAWARAVHAAFGLRDCCIRRTPPQENEDYPTRSYRMVGTALVFAFLANRHVIPSDELAREAAKTARLFEGITCSTGKDFRTLYNLFTALLYPYNIPTVWRTVSTLACAVVASARPGED